VGSLTFDLNNNSKTLTKSWKYKDLQVPLTSNTKDIQSSTDVQAIFNSIHNIFNFIKGERILQPEFGNNLRQYLHQPITDLTARLINRELTDVFVKWEPRITIDDIIIIPFPDQNTYEIQLYYSIPSLNVGNLTTTTVLEA